MIKIISVIQYNIEDDIEYVVLSTQRKIVPDKTKTKNKMLCSSGSPD